MATCPKCRAQYPDDTEQCPADGETLLPDAAFAAVDPDLEPGQTVADYRIEKKVGAGGFGTVYRAIHPLIGKKVAVKVLSRAYSANPQMVSRFIEEARAVNQIRHRNIIDIFSFGMLEDKRHYFVMEYLEGRPFDQVLDERERLTPEEAIALLRQIAKALDAAHAAGIVHRDLKPENVFICTDDDGQAFPKLLDFGIAKLMGDSREGAHKTRTGQLVGTPYYMSPEQCLGKPVDQRSDIYSLGIVTHEVLTGKLPFDAPEAMSVLLLHISKPPLPMSTVWPALARDLDRPVLQMLAKDPAERPESASAAIEALAQAAQDAGHAVEPATTRRSSAQTPAELLSGLPARGSSAETVQQSVERTASGDAETVALNARTAGTSLVTPPVSSSTASAVPASRLTRQLGVAVGAVVLVSGLGAVLLLGGGSGAPADYRPDASGTGRASASATQLAVTSSAAAPASAAAADAAPAEVAITIESTPPEVEIYLATERLGTAPGPVRMAQSDEPVALTFKAAGHATKTTEIVPSKDRTLKIELARLRTPVPPPSSLGPEVEY